MKHLDYKYVFLKDCSAFICRRTSDAPEVEVSIRINCWVATFRVKDMNVEASIDEYNSWNEERVKAMVDYYRKNNPSPLMENEEPCNQIR